LSCGRYLSAYLFAVAGVCALLFLAGMLPARSEQTSPTRGITPEDYYALEFLTDPHISPDGKSVVYVVTTIDRERNRRWSSLWIIPIDGTDAARRLTKADNARSPRWSPDGRKLAFISSRLTSEGSAQSSIPQVYVLSMEGREADRLSSLPAGVEEFQWSPDGNELVCVSKVRPGLPSVGGDVRDYTSITYKTNSAGWFDSARPHIFIIDLRTRAAKQITSGEDHLDSNPNWSPDGKQVAYVSMNANEAGEDRTEIWVIPASGGTPTRVSEDGIHSHDVSWSQDGTRIAYFGARMHDHVPRVWLAPSAGGGGSVEAVSDLGSVFPAGNLRWHANSRFLDFTGYIRGEIQLFRADLQSHTLRALTSGPRTIEYVDLDDNANAIVYAANDPTHLDDLFAAEISGTNERRLTRTNQTLWTRVEPQELTRVAFTSADSCMIDGFLLKPFGWQAGKKYPMVLLIHGGPEDMYGFQWFFEAQVYAARGWAVFYTNPRGSGGYGAKFADAVVKDWGGKPFRDIIAGVESVQHQVPWIDRQRLGVTGGSYGGFMTNWIVGHTDVFKAAIAKSSISDFISDEGTRDFAYGHQEDFGDLFENFEFYWESSPLRYARNVKTPILILHGASDERVPLGQAEEWFRALKHFGATVEFVIFPRENHSYLRSGEPNHLVESMKWQLYWFDRYMNGNEGAVKPNAAQ
jgi:dipeptidyl aminopeptidase/acylaminoacyl peptidase